MLSSWNQVEDLRQQNDSPLFKFELHPKISAHSPQQDRKKSNDPKRASRENLKIFVLNISLRPNSEKSRLQSIFNS